HLATASSELAGEMAKIGVRVEVADAKEKSLPASLRSAQDSSRWLLRKHDGNDRSLAGSIQALCRYAQIDHEFRIRDGHGGVNSREIEDRIQQWLCSGLIPPDTLMRDNTRQPLRCHYDSETQLQTIPERIQRRGSSAGA